MPALLSGLLMTACATELPPGPENGGHLSPPPDTQTDSPDIPDVVDTLPLVSEPGPEQSPELYSIVAQDVPVRELLFAMARDADINVDIHPQISGQVYLNAIDQTLPQILERIARQVDMRWREDGNGNLVVEPDRPYWHTYRIDYVNVERNSSTSADVSTSLANVNTTQGGGGNAGGNNLQNNNSSSSLTQSSTHSFWNTLRDNLNTLLANGVAGSDGNIISNPETGVINVRATDKQHEEVAEFLNFVQTRSLHQVLIEATVVEVDLNDRYQSGVDWNAVVENGAGSIDFIQNITNPELSGNPTNVLTISRDNNNDVDINATVRLLSRFGDLRVLSSPKLMALNNQASMLRVVDNKVYFNVEVEPAAVGGIGVGTTEAISTTIQTVPVGFVMTVTPQIGDGEQVTLHVRPTISRILRFVNDPNPVLAEFGVVNEVPEIQIREMESVLKLYSGEIAILGGLMQDSLEQSTSGLPGLSRLPGLRNLFSNRDDSARKTELIVFIRPVIVREPSLARDLREYREYLPSETRGQGF